MWGATSANPSAENPSTDFNPRAPCGARLATYTSGAWGKVFQSTRPVWGATKKYGNTRRPKGISIHAPRVGRDGQNGRSPSSSADFNPRAPCGARLQSYRRDFQVYYFNPRAPCGARPRIFLAIVNAFKISIHAPRVGRDIVAAIQLHTLPRFQSTRPVWGATTLAEALREKYDHFNPRAPCGARHGCRAVVILAHVISIHAPRVGRDLIIKRHKFGQRISIHAPRVGRDCFLSLP